MRGRTDASGAGRVAWKRGVGVFVLLAACYYALWGGCIALMGAEGSLPAASRLPDVPADAVVVERTMGCGSGGCWRELHVRPAPGQSLDELAEEMDVADRQDQGWRWNDPWQAWVGSHERDGVLVVVLGYRDLVN